MADGASELVLAIRVNGVERRESVPARLTLIELLRDRLGLTGTKLACSRAVCGACTVLVDGQPAASCALFAFQINGSEILTIEGLADKESAEPHPIQTAFATLSGFQCGYCTPGMIMLAKALLDREKAPARETVIEWVSAIICRCTGYAMIVDAILDAARRMREEKAG